jgi:MarR family transcriptional regulator, organic hydroperoxide resistance regulator
MDAEKTARKDKRAEARRISEAMRDLLNIYRARFEYEFGKSGVSLPQLRMLKAVQHGAERSAASLARECHVTPQTLHTMLARAAREGWIARGSSGSNHRIVTATLTTAGEALLQQGSALKEATEAEMWADVPLKAVRQTRKTLEAGLQKLMAAPRKPDLPA